MTTTDANRDYLNRLAAEARDTIANAQIAGAVARGELRPTTRERLLRLSSRYMLHREAGRVRAAAAVKRMAQKIHDAAQQEA